MQKTNKIFLGCNYQNKKVKTHFNNLKKTLEETYPIRVVLIDKERGRGSRDIWKEIVTGIEESSLAIFDVSAFRPNVVLELGNALAIKDLEKILITFDERKPRQGKKPTWLLSDIGHLNQIRYKELNQLDEEIEDNLDIVPAIAGFKQFCRDTLETNAPEKYEEEGLKVLKHLRDRGVLSDQQLEGIIRGSGIRKARLTKMLKKNKLAKRSRGRQGRWGLVEL